jgi:hypothetical protein
VSIIFRFSFSYAFFIIYYCNFAMFVREISLFKISYCKSFNLIESLDFHKSSPSQDYFLFFHWEDFRRRPKILAFHQRQRIQHIHHLDFDPCEEPKCGIT